MFRDSLSEVEKLPIIDRILRKPRTRSVQLQYTTLRSLLYASLGDLQAALRALQPIVDDLKRNRLAPPGWDEIYMAARLFDHRHHLTNDRSDYDEAVTYYRQVPLEHLKPYGQARLLRELGALYSRAGEHQDAVRTLRAALDVDSADEIQVSLILRCSQRACSKKPLSSSGLSTGQTYLQRSTWSIGMLRELSPSRRPTTCCSTTR